ncbi:hypothetical protein SAE01_23780 [Segetibacter aerophilus]|uniref:Uncharacterized protein n=1 Tax=Segetibacter aerophilus TaxID=670293 RepID=A0A512BD36_9BACT|nr:hypothetical protein SAE01_23780 [Segetibacter aerophilus]
MPFNIGLSDEYGSTYQVDTGDIAWSPLILQFGIFGTIVLVFVYSGFFKKFMLLKEYPLMQTGILYIVALFITSFYSVLIFLPQTICLLMLFVAYAINVARNKRMNVEVTMLEDQDEIAFI